ncbi:hypothetical protein GCM10011571_34460 [Marinithermofilum abyssi]|uniref:Uncharacterized protein n=1 Tax=Marinithermofilum abyssi TaxID=1571185 RepID=A0A8J2VJZ0_9BACL|nr:hypothetical protein GCM10011571_34460 [Marinithermofilum abyssi]
MDVGVYVSSVLNSSQSASWFDVWVRAYIVPRNGGFFLLILEIINATGSSILILPVMFTTGKDDP